MKIEFKKKLPITIVIMVASISTFVCAVLSIHSGNNWKFSVLTQGSLCLTMLLSGANCFIYQKQKMLGVFIWLVSGFLLFVVISTIYVGLQKKNF
jgi:hypothetical protein